MKKILAVAIASAFAAPAFAATANVDVYGIAALSVDYVDGGSGGANTVANMPSESRARVTSNTSVIGFKGSEDLGGGLSAIWQMESAVAMDQNFSIAGGRNTFAGLSHKSWGSLTFGLRDTAHKLATARLDVFGGGNQLADYRSLFGAVSNGSIRANNSITYISPNMAGFVVQATTAAMQEDGSSSNPHLYSLSASYTAGPLFLTLAHEDMKFARTSGDMFGAAGAVINATGTAEAEQKNTRLGVGYTLGDLRLGAAWERTQVDVTGALAANANFGTTSAQSTDRDAWYLSGAYKLGNNTLKAAYTNAGELDGLANSGAQQWSVGVDHALSKRTTVFALATQVRNDGAASYGLGGNPTSTGTFQSGGGTGFVGMSAAAPGEDPRGISIGMIHRF